MRIFAVKTDNALPRREQSALGRRLLSYAVGRVWGRECPAIAVGENGKPFFAGAEGMYFSISHTDGWVVAAVAEHEVGVDAERVRPFPPKTAQRLFSPEMLEAFGCFGGWTLRESVYKLCGEGSLRKMNFSLENGEIVAPFPGVKCRIYGDLPGCAAAAACRGGNLAEQIEIVDPAEI